MTVQTFRRTPADQRRVYLALPYGCARPDSLALLRAERFCGRLRAAGITPQRVRASECGGIEVVFVRDGRRRVWARLNDGREEEVDD